VTNDNAAKKRSSLRSETRTQFAASKTSQPVKHSQRSQPAGASLLPSAGRPIITKLADSSATEKCGEAKAGNAGVGVMAATDKCKHWIHVTQRELDGLRQLVEFLEGLDTAGRHVPSELQSPDELLATAKVMSVT